MKGGLCLSNPLRILHEDAVRFAGRNLRRVCHLDCSRVSILVTHKPVIHTTQLFLV